MIEARHVDVLAADAAIVAGRRAGERGQDAARVESDLLAQIAADDVRAVAEAVRVPVATSSSAGCGSSRRVLAPTITTLPSTCCSAPVTRSKYCTPLARPLSSTRTRAATAFDRISRWPVFERERQQVIRGVEERRRVAARPAVAAVVARREAARRRASCSARRPATIGMPTLPAAFCSSRSPQRGAGGGCRNLLPGSESESSVPPQTPISCST